MAAKDAFTTIDRQVEQYDEAIKYWEVSLYDLSQDILYLDWLKTSFNDMIINSVGGILQGEDYLLMSYPVPPVEVLREMLHKYGMDIEEPINKQTLIHRTFGNKKVYGNRWVGLQRTDKEWLNFLQAV